MANKLYRESAVQNIADAIRQKNGLSSVYKVSQMAQAVLDLRTSGIELITSSQRNNLTEISSSDFTTVGDCAFASCSNLTTAEFPECSTIGFFAFNGCSKLSSISFPKCKTIKAYAFSQCNSLINVSFPEVTDLGNSVFASCLNLEAANFSKL